MNPLARLLLAAIAALPLTVAAQSVLQGASSVGLKPSVYWMPAAPALRAGQPDFYGAHGLANPQAGLSSVRMGFSLSPRWDVQVGLQPSAGLGGTQDRLARQRQTLFGADALYLFGASDLRPFLLVGLGSQREARLGDDAVQRANAAAAPFVNTGVGLQYRWSSNLGLQADWRRVQGFGRDQLGNVGLRGPENTFNFGMTWSFGGPN
jgi:OmpA-OmpF porin, OOP family